MERRLPFVLSVVSLFAFSLLFANVALAQTSSCVRATPLLEYSNPSSGSFSETANSQTGAITVAHTYTIKVTNKDSTSCGSSTFQFNFGTPPLYVTLDGKNQPFFASIKTIPAGKSAEVTGSTGNVGLNLVKSPQTFEIPVVVSRLLEAKTPSLDSTTVKSVTQGSYTMTVGFDKPSYAGGGTAAYFGTLKKNGVVFSGKAISVQIFKTKSGVESMESQTSLTTATDGSFSGKITIDTLASKYRLIARYTDSSSPTSPVTVTLINSFCGSSDCSKSFGSVPAATNENPSGTIKLKIVVTRELSCLNTKGYEPAITIRSQTGTRDIVSGQELTFDVSVLNREVDCPDERFGSPLVGVADRTDPLRPIETEDTGAKVWEVRIDGNSPSRLPTTSAPLPGISKAKFFLWQDFGIKDYTLKSYASASHRLTLKAPLAPGEVGNTRNFVFCISSISQICQTILVKVLPSGTGDKTPPSITSVYTNPSPAVVSKPVTFVAKVSDNAAVDRIVFSVDRNKNGGFDTSEIQTKTLSSKITSGEVSADSPVTFDSIGTYKYKIDVFDTSNNPSSSEGTITVGDGTTPPLSVGGTSNTGSEGDKIELLLDKGSYSTDDVMTITGTLTLKSETPVSPYVDIEFFDSSGKSIAKAPRPVTGGSFAYKPSVKTNLGISATDQVKVVASYTSASTSKILVSVEKMISIGGQVSQPAQPSSATASNSNDQGDKIEFGTDKGSYVIRDILALTGSLTLKTEALAADTNVVIEFLDADGKSINKFTKPVASDSKFDMRVILDSTVKSGKLKIVASYISKSTTKPLVFVENTVSVGSTASQPASSTGSQSASKTNTEGDEIKISTDKSSYIKGEIVQLSGILTSKSGAVKDASIDVEIYKPDNSILNKFTKTTDSSGSFTSNLLLDDTTPVGTLKIVMKYSVKSLSVEKTLSVAGSSGSVTPTTGTSNEKTATQSGYIMTLKFDKSTYNKNEIATFSGTLKTESGTPVTGAAIDIDLYKKKGDSETLKTLSQKITTDSGVFSGSLLIDPDLDIDSVRFVAKYKEESVSVENSFTISPVILVPKFPEIKTKTDGVSIAVATNSFKIGDIVPISIGAFSGGKSVPNTKVKLTAKIQDQPDVVLDKFSTDSEGKLYIFALVDVKATQISASFDANSQTYTDKIDVTTQ